MAQVKGSTVQCESGASWNEKEEAWLGFRACSNCSMDSILDPNKYIIGKNVSMKEEWYLEIVLKLTCEISNAQGLSLDESKTKATRKRVKKHLRSFPSEKNADSEESGQDKAKKR